MTLDADNGEAALVCATRTAVPAQRLVAWGRRADRMYAGAFAPVGGRLSSPPRIEDFNRLLLSSRDLETLRGCRPNDCRIKLAAAEILEVTAAMRAAGTNWRPAGSEAFRNVLVRRATAYTTRGFAGLVPTQEGDSPVDPTMEFRRLLAAPERRVVSAWGVDRFLWAFPDDRDAAESAFFWWKNAPAGTKEVVVLTHVAIFQDPDSDDVVVAETQIYASRYLDGSIAYLILTGKGEDRALVYFRRAKVDVLRGFFGGIIRGMLERRIRDDAPKLIAELEKRLASGDPPDLTGSR
jgi:hypothetical protein